MPLAFLTITTSTVNSKCVPSGENKTRCVTFNIIPSNRTDVDYFSITNSQNDEVMKVEPTERSITLCHEPGIVTFTVDTVYTCSVIGDISNQNVFQFLFEGECKICTYSVGSSGFYESVLIYSIIDPPNCVVGYLAWAIVATVIAIGLLITVIVLAVLWPKKVRE